ncbi:hypothetical protein RhiirB3_395468 [Rhizophagus irregularis]|nr:hypothetical protein RhiirB3_395468 [Rhizophagus irregularis]
MEKVRNRENTSNKKRKIDKSIVGQTTMTAFHDSTNLPEARINRINCALVKFFIYCGIAFRIVEHPFFIDLLKELNAGYDPPTREYLSSRLLKTELCNVNKKMNENIMNQRNLTLDRLLRRVNILTAFFRNLHMAGSKFRKLIEESGIKGGGLKSYCITRWTTSSESVNSVLNLKPVFEKMVNEYENLLTNQRIKLIIQGRNFFPDLEILAFVLNPLQKAILFLESRSATLADCYLSLAQLGVKLRMSRAGSQAGSSFSI